MHDPQIAKSLRFFRNYASKSTSLLYQQQLVKFFRYLEDHYVNHVQNQSAELTASEIFEAVVGEPKEDGFAPKS